MVSAKRSSALLALESWGILESDPIFLFDIRNPIVPQTRLKYSRYRRIPKKMARVIATALTFIRAGGAICGPMKVRGIISFLAALRYRRSIRSWATRNVREEVGPEGLMVGHCPTGLQSVRDELNPKGIGMAIARLLGEAEAIMAQNVGISDHG